MEVLKINWGRPVSYLVLVGAALVAIIPFAWALSTSFKTDAQAFRMPPEWMPNPLILDNFRRAITGGIIQASLNSVTVTCATIVTTLTFALFAGYSISRLKWKGSGLVLLILIAPQMLPGIINLVPIYIMMSKLQLLNNLFALILVYSAQNIPLSVWLLKSYFDSVPWSLEDAAIIDGCSKPQRLFHIMLPLSQPGLAAAGIFVFMNSWNEFLTASTLLTTKGLLTIPVIVYSFIRDYMIDWTGLMAAAWFAAVPIIIVFVILQRRFISGLSSGIGKE